MAAGEREVVRASGPNILMVMSDQHRGDWLGCAGADWVNTPNIDALAARGMWFPRNACNSPVCAPSRAALASGLACSTVGVLANRHLYPLGIPTYYQSLREAGYRVGCVGKTDLHKRDHWEGRNGDRPIMYHLGFTDPMETEGKQSASRYSVPPVCPYTHYLAKHNLGKIFEQDYVTRNANPGGRDSVLPLHAYHDDFIGRNACRFLENVDEETPWHYFVSFVGPHDPWDAPQKYAEQYDAGKMPADQAIADTMEGKPERYQARAEGSEGLLGRTLAGIMAQYAGMISIIDDYVGRFEGILKERGILDNTVVIYCSDHGEMMGDHGMFGKQTYYESPLRVPLVLAGPGVRKGGNCDALVHLADMAPTILEMAGVEHPLPMQARSLCPLLRGDSDSVYDFQFSELAESRMIFDGRFKYVQHDDDRDELYDLEDDPRELENLAERDGVTVERLQSRIKEYLASAP
jgi:arylsulfatase